MKKSFKTSAAVRHDRKLQGMVVAMMLAIIFANLQPVTEMSHPSLWEAQVSGSCAQ